ncbi:MAG: class I SAM-dependent methyltransferase [Terriglobia bacterium]
MATPTVKPYKGIGMEGVVAKWYATNTRKALPEFQALARRVAEGLPSGSHVLELAPGPGYFAIELAGLGSYQITGLDVSKTFVEIAQRNAREAKVDVIFRQGNSSAMPLESDSFDFLLCRAAFKNFSEPVGALQEMCRVLKTGGRALIIDLRRDTPWKSISQSVDGMGLSFVNRIITKLTFRFLLLRRAYTKNEIQQFISQTGFRRANIQDSLIGYEISLEK